MIEAIPYEPSLLDRARWAVKRVAWRVVRRAEDAALRFLLRREMKDSNLLAHAKRELAAIGEDEWTTQGILDLLAVFSRQGHSGSSAPYVASRFKTLANFDPIGPLTGADSEWNEVGHGMWQNNRCGRVFKDADGRAYDIEGRVFRDPDGACYTNRESRVYVEFPYTPHTEYVDVAAE